MGELNSLDSRYGAANYEPLPVTLVRAKGVHVWDEDGRRYIDLMGAYSAVSFGHCHPRLVEAMTRQARQLDICVSRLFHQLARAVSGARYCGYWDEKPHNRADGWAGPWKLLFIAPQKM